MQMPPLEPFTVLVVSALVIGFSGAVLILARGRDRSALPLALWGAAMLAGAAGMALLTLVPFIDWPARMMGNVAILAGLALSWTGARIFAGRRFRPVLACGGAGAWLVVFVASLGRAEYVATLFGFLLGPGYVLATAAELWRGRAEHLPSRMVAVAALVVHAAVYLVLAASSVLLPVVVTSEPLFIALVLEALLHTTGMAFLFLALMKERAELRSTMHLRSLALRDGLTGLGNRRHFDELLGREYQAAMRTRSPLALLMIDVDHFKAFNDTYGHLAGDESLKAVAAAMKAAVLRGGDMLVRYGGEEFVVLLPQTTLAGGLAVAEAVRTRVEQLRVRHSRSAHGAVTVSIGVAAIIPHPGDRHPRNLMEAADRALYQAKLAGRNQCQGIDMQAGSEA